MLEIASRLLLSFNVHTRFIQNSLCFYMLSPWLKAGELTTLRLPYSLYRDDITPFGHKIF